MLEETDSSVATIITVGLVVDRFLLLESEIVRFWTSEKMDFEDGGGWFSSS